MKHLNKKSCINEDSREVAQAYYRVVIFVCCTLYCLYVNPTPYIEKVALVAFLFTISWFVIVWRNIGSPVYRHVAGMVYDCSILGFVMVELGRDFIGLYVVLPLISIGYGIRYRSKAYLWLGIILTVLTFCVAINIKPWGDAAVLYALILTLVLVPLKQIKPISEMIEAISAL